MRSSYKGFTLLEVLIAIGLLSLLMLMLFSALRTGTRAWDAVDKQSQLQNEQRHVSRFLIQRLEQIKRLYVVQGGKKSTTFIGDSDQVTFVTPLFEYTNMAGLYYLQYLHDTGTHELQIRFVPFMDKQQPAEDIGQADAELLLKNVDDFSISYLSKSLDWLSNWNEDGYPRLMKIIVTVAGEKWPEIIVKIER